MEVYIEYAIIDNLVMDFLLLKAAARLTKTETSGILLSFGAALGCFIAIIVPMFDISSALAFLIKIILAMLITLVSARHKTIFGYLKFLNIFLLLTFAVGGAVIGILSLMGIDYSSSSIRSNGVLPVGVNFLVAVLMFKLIKKVTESVLDKLENDFVCDVEIIACGKTKKFKGYVDSGNTLVDAKTGLPVIVCDKNIVAIFFGANAKPKRYMPITTASGIGMLELFEIDGVRVKTKSGENYVGAILGVCKSTQKLAKNADVIIGACLI